jgi:hypothetical protein
MKEPGFIRSHAIDALESLSLLVSSYAALLGSFPENPDADIWRREMTIICKALRDMSIGRKSRSNYSADILLEEFFFHYSDLYDCETIEMLAEARGLDGQQLNWKAAKEVIQGILTIILE